MISIRFIGGAGTVTGSKFLFETAKYRILIDCGLFQGLKELRLQNWAPFPIDPRSIDAVILTHAHLDHSGYVPLLVKQGFAGKIYCSPPTRDLARIILLDSAHLQLEDAEYANEAGYSKHKPALPLYTEKDVINALKQFVVIRDGHWNKILEEFKFRLSPSGHILGSTFIELDYHGKRTVFSGDLGRAKPLTLYPPTEISRADYLVVESTYGDRDHLGQSTLKDLERIVNETCAKKGQLIIPSFAVGRTQDMLYLFSQLKRQKRIPDLPIFVDTPMGINATEVLISYPEWHKLSADEVRRLWDGAIMVRSQQQSKEVSSRRRSAIVIAGSGMAAGGRVLHHLAKRLPSDRNTVLLVGFQSAGSRGKSLQDGATELKIHGEYVPVRARVENLFDLSAHADQSEILKWLKSFRKAPQKTFIVHGEPHASDVLRVKIKDTLGWSCMIPKAGEEFQLL